MKKTTVILTAALLTTSLTATGIAYAHGTEQQQSSSPNATQMSSEMPMHGAMSAKHGKAMGSRMGHMTGSGMGHMTGSGMGHMMGSGMGRMMGQGMGHGMMMGGASYHFQGQDIDRNLSADDVRKILDGHLVWMGHKRLVVGEVKKQDDGSLIANINTVDGSLVTRMEVDPKTGAMHRANE